MTARNAQDLDKYVLRFPDGMRDRIREAAEANKRSMNAEIVSRIESTFVDEDGRVEAAGRLEREILTGEYTAQAIHMERLTEALQENIERMKRLEQKMIAAGLVDRIAGSRNSTSDASRINQSTSVPDNLSVDDILTALRRIAGAPDPSDTKKVG